MRKRKYVMDVLALRDFTKCVDIIEYGKTGSGLLFGKLSTLHFTVYTSNFYCHPYVFFFNIPRNFRVGWKTRSAECGVRSVENAEYGKCGVWKMRSVENAEYGKCGVWKMRSMENAEYGKCGVWKMRSIACGNALTFLFNIKNA